MAKRAVALAALILAVGWCHVLADCPFGTESSKPGGPCDRCQDDFGGEPPNCKPCYISSGASVRKPDGTKVCECQKGTSGIYPKCTTCPAGLGTDSDGDGKKCTCIQGNDQDAIYNPKSIGCASCNANNGWYERGLYTNPPSFKYPPGKVCILCKESDNEKGLVVKDNKCVCDTSKGYGYSLEYKGFTTAYSFCQKCDGSGNTALAKDGRCVCKEGYGVVPGLSFNYCVKCVGGKVDQYGFCKCSKGYAYSYDASQCIKCSGPKFELRKDGKCYCGKGYEGLTNIFNSNVNATCTKCPATSLTTVITDSKYNACVCKDKRQGQYYKNFRLTGCVCRWGFEPKGDTCTYSPFCASRQYKVEYWVGSKLPSGFDGKSFPAALTKVAPSATATAIKADWAAGAWPSLPAEAKSGKFAARITRCVCKLHKDWDTAFKYAVVKDAKGYAKLVIDGGQTERRKGVLYDDNINLRPGVIPVLPVQGKAAAGKAATIRVVAPKYNPNPRPWLSGFDSVPNIQNYEACHQVEVLYASADGAGLLKVVLPTKPV